MDHSDLDKQIKRLQDLAERTVARNTGWQEVWDEIKKTGEDFKQTRYPSRTAQNAAWEYFQKV